jgi:hypothetical protein
VTHETGTHHSNNPVAPNKAKRIPRAIGNCARRYVEKSSRADLKDPKKKEKHFEKQSLRFESHQEGEGPKKRSLPKR